MSDFGMSSFLNNQQGSVNNYNFGVLEHNKEQDDHLQRQLNTLKGTKKTEIIGDVLTHTQDAGKEAFLTGELSGAVKRYGKYKQDYNVDELGHVTGNKNYLTQNAKHLKDKYSAKPKPESEPLSNETRGVDAEGTNVARDTGDIPSVRPDPRGARLTLSEDPSDLQEQQEEGNSGDNGAVNEAEDTGMREGNPVGAGGDTEEAGSLGAKLKSAISGKTGISEEGLDVASYGAKKTLMGGLALANTIEDISSGHLQGDNWEEKVGDLGSQIGGGLDMVGTFIPVLEPLGAGISVVSGILSGIGHLEDDFKHKTPDVNQTKSLTDKSNALKMKNATSNSYQQMGLVSSISKNPTMNIGTTSVF